MEIYIARNGETLGPYLEGQVKEMVQNGMLLPMDLAWSEQGSEWQPLYKVAGIVPGPAARPSPPPATVFIPPSSPIASEYPTYIPSQKANDDITEEDIALYAGWRNRHYVKAWRNYDAPSLFRRISGNAGFLIGSFAWLFYRKMYRLGMIVSMVAVALILLERSDMMAAPALLLIYAITAIVYIFFSMYYVDRLYLKRAEARILAIKSQEKNRFQQQALIKEVGGTRPFLAIAMFVLVCNAPAIWDGLENYRGLAAQNLKQVSSENLQGSEEPKLDVAQSSADAEMIATLRDKLRYSNVRKLDGMPARFCGKRTVIAAQQGNEAVIAFPAGTSPVFIITADDLGIDGHPGKIKSVFSGEKGGVQYVFAVGNDNKYSAFWAADAKLRAVYPGADCTFQIVGGHDLKSILSEPIQP